MKKFLVIAVLLLSVGSASADMGSLPTSDALSFGTNAQGCYYTSENQKLVYSKDFSILMDHNEACERSLNVSDGYNYSSVVNNWRESIIDFLRNLVQ